MPALSVLAHHSEPSDPVLLRWIIDTFEALFGFAPVAIVIPVAVFLVAFPALLGYLALRSRRRYAADDESAGRDGRLAK